MVLRGWDVRVAAIGVVIAVLAGCTSAPAPQVSPTPTPTPAETVVVSPSPTPSPTPTALTEEEILAAIPERAHVEDFPGAQDFLEFFISLYPKLFQEPYDGRLFQALSGPECVFCQSAIENQEIAGSARASTTGGDFTFEWLVAKGGLRETGDWLIEQRFSVSDTEYLDEKGSVTRVTEGGHGTVVARLRFVESLWVVDDIAFEFDDE